MEDVLRDRQEMQRDYELRLHFPDDKQIEILGSDTVRVASTLSGRVMQVQVLSGPFSGVDVVRERTEAPMAGWRSRGIGHLAAAKTIIWHAQGHRGFASHLRLSFDP